MSEKVLYVSCGYDCAGHKFSNYISGMCLALLIFTSSLFYFGEFF